MAKRRKGASRSGVKRRQCRNAPPAVPGGLCPTAHLLLLGALSVGDPALDRLFLEAPGVAQLPGGQRPLPRHPVARRFFDPEVACPPPQGHDRRPPLWPLRAPLLFHRSPPTAALPATPPAVYKKSRTLPNSVVCSVTVAYCRQYWLLLSSLFLWSTQGSALLDSERRKGDRLSMRRPGSEELTAIRRRRYLTTTWVVVR